jgi:hypothetical protein
MGKEKATNWINKRLDEANMRRKEALDKKGFKEFFTCPVGETTLEIKAEVEPREKDGDYGTQAIFRIVVDKTEKDFSVGLKSPLYRVILEALSKGKSKFTIVRTGEKKETRYTVKKVW